MFCACSFQHGALPGTDAASCTSPWWNGAYAHRYRVDTTAPAGYTLQIDATAALATSFTSTRNDVRVVVDHATELDRILTGSMLEVKVPPTGQLWIYTGTISPTSPPADPANVYLFAESFETFPAGDNVTARFDAQPPTEWSVVVDGGNHIYHAQGTYRHPAAIQGMTLADGEIRARVRWGPAGGQQHNGLAARGSSMDIATMDGFVGQLQADVQHTRLAEYTDGISPPAELLVQNFTVERARWYAMRLRFVGDALELNIDGSTTLATTKSGSNGQLVGIYAHDTDVDYDDIIVRPLMQPEPTVTLGPDEMCSGR